MRRHPSLTFASGGPMTVPGVLDTHTSVLEPVSRAVRVKKSVWATAYVRRLRYTDLAAILASVTAAQLVRFGTHPAMFESASSFYSYTLVSALVIAAWLSAIALFRGHDEGVLASGAEECRRIAHASFAVFGTVAIVSYLLKLELARGYLAVALPLGLVTLVVTRRLWRRWLQSQRMRGRFSSSVLVVGSHGAAAAMALTFERARSEGYQVAGVCVPGWGRGEGGSVNIDGHVVPVLGNEDAVLDALEVTGADIVAVSNTEFLGVDGMRTLAWELEAVDVDLVVCPGVVDVAGPRLQIRPVAGLPLLHVDKPQYQGASNVGKVIFDTAGALIGLIVLSPLLVAVGLAISLDSRGPILYRAERVGLNGKPFFMLKFRSMVSDADVRRNHLLQHNEGAGPLFKIRDDPRVTRVGRWIRRLSIDELPQLVNVLCGQMSLVGPRPPLSSEVMTYTGDVHRRLLVKPGITGLWQVSGRSNLSWEESVRLDLSYVENWSWIQDLMIMSRTVGAVIRARGAY